jgi:hypothetical protein
MESSGSRVCEWWGGEKGSLASRMNPQDHALYGKAAREARATSVGARRRLDPQSLGHPTETRVERGQADVEFFG